MEYKDGEKVWMPYGKRKDMIDSTLEALQIYCVHTPELYTFLTYDGTHGSKMEQKEILGSKI